jgi:hypothetical protein
MRDVEAIATRAAAEAAQVTAIGEKRDATPNERIDRRPANDYGPP